MHQDCWRNRAALFFFFGSGSLTCINLCILSKQQSLFQSGKEKWEVGERERYLAILVCVRLLFCLTICASLLLWCYLQLWLILVNRLWLLLSLQFCVLLGPYHLHNFYNHIGKRENQNFIAIHILDRSWLIKTSIIDGEYWETNQ